ncbi:MAG: hypothetical protein IJ060_13210 [Oscillospiraceae bacterium]|nr:hypothetical protein [Oscillospiraceae bacterium]
MELQYMTAETLIGEIRKKHKKQRTISLIVLIFGVLVSAFFYMVALPAGIILTVITVIIPLILFLYFNSKLKNTEGIGMFRRYGTPDEMASLLRGGSGGVLHQSRSLLLTKQFLMNPNDLESIIPLSCVQLAYIHTSSYNGIPTSQTMKVHDIYNSTLEFSFKLGKKGRAEIVEILTAMNNAAPWIVVGYSPQNVRNAAQNKIKIGDPRPVRQLPEQTAPANLPPVMPDANTGGYPQ